MFSWLRRLLKGVPARPDAGQRGGGGGGDSALALLAEALVKHGHDISARPDHLLDVASQFSIACMVHGVTRREDGTAQTVSTVTVTHPTLVPDGLFEFQHSWGPDARASLLAGFDRWVQTDYVTLVDSTMAMPDKCMVLEMEFPVTPERPARKRRAVLGPIEHLRTEPPPPPPPETCPSAGRQQQSGDHVAEDPKHPFCPCCLLTRSLDAFQGLLERDGYFGLRMFTMRGADGGASADCRVNGEDFDAGKRGLLDYVQTWPAAGVEFRKQYVVIQDSPGPARA